MKRKGMVKMVGKLRQFARSFSESFKTISTLNERLTYVNKLQFHSDQNSFPKDVELFMNCISTRYAKKLIDSNIEVFVAPEHASCILTNTLDAMRGIGALALIDDQPVLIVNSTQLAKEIEGLSQYQAIVVFEAFLEHELEHLRQINRGELNIYRENGENIVEWKGTKYLFNYINSLPPALYDDLPWEHEAVSAEISYLVRLGYYADLSEGWSARIAQYSKLNRHYEDNF